MTEEIIEEDDKIYEVLVAEKGEGKKPYSSHIDAELLLGPYLSKEKNQAFQKKWSIEKANWERIIGRLETANETEETAAKRQELSWKIALVQEVLGNESN